jgi:hypothetical protein
MVPMQGDGIVWLASYPKSGNTWLRSFFSAYLDPGGAIDLNRLSVPSAANRALLDNFLGVSTADFTAKEIRQLLPIAFRSWHQAPDASRLVKVHDCFGYTTDGLPIFPEDVTRGVIHIVRDPRDVVLSLMHHEGISLEATIRRLSHSNSWIANGGGERVDQVPQFISDWSTHSQSWRSAPLPRLQLRYEDLLADPRSALADAVRFCGIQMDPRKFDAAIVSSSFSRLQAMERAGGFRERLARSTAPFFRQGSSGRWRNVLSAAQADQITSAHGGMMRLLGYET